MTNWERKRDKMRRQIVVGSNIVIVTSLLIAAAAVFSCVKATQKLSDKHFEQMYRLKQEMQKQK